MTNRLLNLKVKKVVSDEGVVTRYYTFVLTEPDAPAPSADCKMHIRDGKIEDIEILILDDDKFDIDAVRVAVTK